MKHWYVPVLAIAIAAPGGAQQWQVAGDQFAFAGSRLTIHVHAEMEGTLRIIRGPSGLVRVSGRSDMGMTGAGLTANDHLTLTAMGDGPIDYLVSVPDGVWINVRLPDRNGSLPMGARDRTRTFQWDPAAAAHAAADPPWTLRTDDPARGAAYTVLSGTIVPETVALPALEHIRSVTVRVEGDEFRVAASRPLALQKGDPYHLEIRPNAPPLELTLVVPAGTGRFLLDTADGAALVIHDGAIEVLCTPSARQWLSGGRAWITFTPRAGELQCGTSVDRRHRG